MGKSQKNQILDTLILLDRAHTALKKAIKTDNQVAVDGMKHFCFAPETIYVGRVVVQSKNMRQIYINEYSKAAKEMGLSGENVDRVFLEKKFSGTTETRAVWCSCICRQGNW